MDEDRFAALVVAVQPVRGRGRGEGWAHVRRTGVHRPAFGGRVRLSNLQLLRRRSGCEIPDSAAIRDHRARPGGNDDPGRGLRPRRRGSSRHGLDDVSGAGRARQAPKVPGRDLHCGAVAISVRVSDLRGNNSDDDRGMRGRMGVLRRHLPRPHSRQHQGDRADGGSPRTKVRGGVS